MLHALRKRAESEKGFTLIELLVVILIIGILAAIAIPSFVNQKTKATDASAKQLARTAQTAAESYASAHNGDYTGLTAAALNTIEPTIQVGPRDNKAYLDSTTGVLGAGTTGYTVQATSTNGNRYSIVRGASGTRRTCTPTTTSAGSGGCVGGSW